MCCYWTSTPSSATAGGEKKGEEKSSYAFYTKYEIDPNNPSIGHMSSKDKAIQEHKRYNGFAIRPVLVREIKKQ